MPRRSNFFRWLFFFRIVLIAPAFLAAALTFSCSPNHFLTHQVALALSHESSGTVFTNDNDIDLMADALPPVIKMYESLCVADVSNGALHLATGRLIASYAYGFILSPSDTLSEESFEYRNTVRRRAARLLIRGRDHALLFLDMRHTGFISACLKGDTSMVKTCGRGDTSALYWSAAAWMAAIIADRANPDLIVTLPTVRALINRLLQLAPDYGQGAFHEFLISYYGGLPEAIGKDIAAARNHFTRACALQHPRSPGPYVALAASVSVSEHNRSEFVALLSTALAIDVEALPRNRLQAALAQAKARWMLDHIDRFFIDEEGFEPDQNME